MFRHRCHPTSTVPDGNGIRFATGIGNLRICRSALELTVLRLQSDRSECLLVGAIAIRAVIIMTE